MATTSINPTPQALTIPEIKHRYGLYSGGDVGETVAALSSEGAIVAGLIQHASVNILVGDSGIGKTALGYQLGLSVAAGQPFLGFPVQKSRVLMVDYENGIWDFHWILEQQRKHLGLESYPPRFLVSPGHPAMPLDEVILQYRPQLVILDSLRSYHPAMERDNVSATDRLKHLRDLVRRLGAGVLLMHHVHKRSGGAALEESSTLEWLLRAAGSRALINQTDVRLALAARKDGDTLVLRGQARTRGEIGPIFLRRAWDEQGDPLGYERFEPEPSLLRNSEYEAAFLRLPDSFTFKDARLTVGKSPESANRFLHRLIDAGLVSKVAFGQYRKCELPQQCGQLV